MAETAVGLAQECDVFIAAAAVADYRVDAPADTKRKKTGKSLTLTLVENPDVLALVGAVRQGGQVLAGFAAETNDLIKNAQAKLEKKKLDLIVANEVHSPESGFGTDTTNAAILDRSGHVDKLPLLSKDELAEKLLDRVVGLLSRS